MALNCATAQDVLKTSKDKDVQMVDLRFTDLPGVAAPYEFHLYYDI
jgi:glutamine synthetase